MPIFSQINILYFSLSSSLSNFLYLVITILISFKLISIFYLSIYSFLVILEYSVLSKFCLIYVLDLMIEYLLF